MTKKESKINPPASRAGNQEIRQETKVEEPAKSEASKVVGEQVIKKQSIFITPLSAKTFFISQVSLLIVGLLFTGGLYYFLNSGYKLDDWRSRGPLTQTKKSLSLEVGNPEDDLVVFDKNLVISGKSSANTILVITDNGRDFAAETNKKGDYSKIINLDPGLNQISITAIDFTGNSKTIEKAIYFSEEKL